PGARLRRRTCARTSGAPLSAAVTRPVIFAVPVVGLTGGRPATWPGAPVDGAGAEAGACARRARAKEDVRPTKTSGRTTNPGTRSIDAILRRTSLRRSRKCADKRCDAPDLKVGPTSDRYTPTTPRMSRAAHVPTSPAIPEPETPALA